MFLVVLDNCWLLLFGLILGFGAFFSSWSNNSAIQNGFFSQFLYIFWEYFPNLGLFNFFEIRILIQNFVTKILN